MADDILNQITSNNGKKILDESDVKGKTNNYGNLFFNDEEKEDGSGKIIKVVNEKTSVGYKTSPINGGEIFNSYPDNDNLTKDSNEYKQNNDKNKAFKDYSHSRGHGTVANDQLSESVLGQYNISTSYDGNNYGVIEIPVIIEGFTAEPTNTIKPTSYTENAILIVGDGSNENSRHNLMTVRSNLDSSGSYEESLSFAGDVDLEGYLHVNDYIYSPTIYTSTIKKPDGTEWDTSDLKETFKLFDGDTTETAKDNAIAHVNLDIDNNKAFYRDQDTQEVYEIYSSLNSEVPVAKSEIIDVNGINIALTNNFFLSMSGATNDIKKINCVNDIIIYDGIFSDEFVEKYCIDSDTYKRLLAISKTNVNITEQQAYSPKISEINYDINNKLVFNDIISTNEEWSGELFSYINKAVDNIAWNLNTNIIDYNKLDDYLFFVACNYDYNAFPNQTTVYAVEKDTHRFICSGMHQSTIKIKDKITKQVSEITPMDFSTNRTISATDSTLRGQLIGTWWGHDKELNIDENKKIKLNYIKDVFPELKWFFYSNSLVPTQIDNNEDAIVDKWNKWYKSIKIKDIFEGENIWDQLDDFYKNSKMDLYTFLSYAINHYINYNPSDLDSIIDKEKTYSFGNISIAQDIKDFVNNFNDFIETEQNDETGLKYVINTTKIINEKTFSSTLYDRLFKIDEAIAPHLAFPIKGTATISFTIENADIDSNLYSNHLGTLREYKIKTIEESDFANDFQKLTFPLNVYTKNNVDMFYMNFRTVISDDFNDQEKTTLNSLNTRYLSQIQTGNKKTLSLSMSNDLGGQLSLLGAEGNINVNTISWANLIDALNENMQLDVLGQYLQQLKTSFSTVSSISDAYYILINNNNISIQPFSNNFKIFMNALNSLGNEDGNYQIKIENGSISIVKV